MQKDIIDMLMELEIEQIEEVRKRHKDKYPDDREYIAKCQVAIGMKKKRQKTNDFISIIEEVKKENAPDSAATPSKGE